MTKEQYKAYSKEKNEGFRKTQASKAQCLEQQPRAKAKEREKKRLRGG